jgi:hypothetical protein
MELQVMRQMTNKIAKAIPAAPGMMCSRVPVASLPHRRSKLQGS